VGRWLSEDPIGFSAGDHNLYRYVANAATNATDPSGLREKDLHKGDDPHGTAGRIDILINRHLAEEGELNYSAASNRSSYLDNAGIPKFATNEIPGNLLAPLMQYPDITILPQTSGVYQRGVGAYCFEIAKWDDASDIATARSYQDAARNAFKQLDTKIPRRGRLDFDSLPPGLSYNKVYMIYDPRAVTKQERWLSIVIKRENIILYKYYETRRKSPQPPAGGWDSPINTAIAVSGVVGAGITAYWIYTMNSASKAASDASKAAIDAANALKNNAQDFKPRFGPIFIFPEHLLPLELQNGGKGGIA
jgi:uncharacterized protein RhaS with RHS repeats